MPSSTQSKEKLCILFLPTTIAALTEYLGIMEQLEKESRFSAAIFADGIRQKLFLPILQRGGRATIAPSGSEVDPTASVPPSIPQKIPLLQRLRATIFSLIPPIIRLWLLRKKNIRQACAILRKYAVRCIIAPVDRCAGWEMVFMKAAQLCGIPALVVPYAVDFKTGIALCRVRMSAYNGTLAVRGSVRRFIAWLFPRWTFRYDGECMFFHNLQEAIVAWLLGMMPDNPWTPGGGRSTLVAAESARIRDLFVHYGVAPQKIVVTGKPSTDKLCHAMQPQHCQTVRHELGNAALGKKIVLCAVPQFGEHGIIPWSQHWHDTELLIATLARFPQTLLVLSLHPKSDPAAYKPYAEKEGSIIAPRRVYELLPACDVYVAAASSTVTQAIAAHRPTVIFDINRADQERFYDDAPGVQVIRDWSHLRPAVEHLLTDSSFYGSQVRAQEERGAEWALMDGRCTERVCACIAKLADTTRNV